MSKQTQNYIDSQQHWEDRINDDYYLQKQIDKQMEKDIEKQIYNEWEKQNKMSKQTAVEWLIEEIHKNIVFIPVPMQEKAKEMEKEQSQNYAIFAIRCDRTEMRILEFNDYIKLEENENK